jgi:hypothetical protein
MYAPKMVHLNAVLPRDINNVNKNIRNIFLSLQKRQTNTDLPNSYIHLGDGGDFKTEMRYFVPRNLHETCSSDIR